MDTSEAAQAVEFALAQYPDLNANGFRASSKQLGYVDRHEEWREELRGKRSLKGVATSIAYVDECHRFGKSTVPNENSYSMKHAAERWGRVNGLSPYVSNGAFIAAAIFRRVPIEYKPEWGPNCNVAISERVVEWLGKLDVRPQVLVTDSNEHDVLRLAVERLPTADRQLLQRRSAAGTVMPVEIVTLILRKAMRLYKLNKRGEPVDLKSLPPGMAERIRRGLEELQ